MTKLLKAVIVLSAILSTMAHAGEYVGKAKPFYSSRSLYIDVAPTRMTNRPACATRTLVRLIEDDGNNQTDPIYKNKFAILFSSWVAGRDVRLAGTGTCTTEGDEIVFTVVPE